MAATPRRSKLIAKAPETVKPRKPKILIYGPSGVGKTTFALDFPNVYYIDVEGGATQPEYRKKLQDANGLYLGPDDGAASFDVVMDQIKGLATEEHDRKTVVIDSVTKLFANEIAREAERLSEAGKKNEFGADRKPATNYMKQLVSWTTRMDMNVIMIAGEVGEWGMDKGERVQIGQTFDCWPRLEYELDLAFQVYKVGQSRYGRVRKSRIAAFTQANSFEWTYDSFIGLYGREAVESEVAPLALITQEQSDELYRLLSIVKLDEGVTDKWLSAANVSSWEEMDTEKAAKVIANLNSRLNKE